MRIEQQMQPEGSLNMELIEKRIGNIEHKLDTLNTSVLTLQGSIMPRAEVYTEDAKRVSLERFEGEMSAARERILRLEGGPQKILAWVGIGTGCASVVIAAIAVIVTMAVAVIPHLH